MIPSTVERVPESTSEATNQKIREQTREHIAEYAQADRAAISRRLAELEQEWDIERLLEANASSLAFTGVALGALVDRRWLILPALVTGFLFQHALQGWCPPLPVLRQLGFRTAREIDEERQALKILRGDYQIFDPTAENKLAQLDQILIAVRKS
jgi:hypothetical protein